MKCAPLRIDAIKAVLWGIGVNWEKRRTYYGLQISRTKVYFYAPLFHPCGSLVQPRQDAWTFSFAHILVWQVQIWPWHTAQNDAITFTSASPWIIFLFGHISSKGSGVFDRIFSCGVVRGDTSHLPALNMATLRHVAVTKGSLWGQNDN